jgi:predicted Rossmann-fold nucleotide-binding protein
VNNLAVMLDIEKGLEAFIRLANGVIVFLSGVGTAEEILYLLCILVNKNNRKQLTPLVLTGPKSAKSYYQIIIGDPKMASKYLAQNISQNIRLFYWNLKIQTNYKLSSYRHTTT